MDNVEAQGWQEEESPRASFIGTG